jgi:S-ribosylhomocysteine lyase LuxS involved in autoinducer biosynthesis
MNKSYISVWNEALGSWVAASENTVARGKRSKSKVVAGAVATMVGLAGLMGSPAAEAAGSGLQLCNGNATNGYSWGSGSATGAALNCSYGGTQTAYGFSLNNAGTDTGDNGFSAATARITGYVNGKLELKGTGGISMLNQVQMNNNTITGLAAGAVNATSVDAINGSQLYGTSSSVANALGGGSTVNPDGTISAPSYSVGGTTVGNVGDAITNIDGRTTTNTNDIAQNTADISGLQGQMADGVTYDSPAHDSVTLGGTGASAPVALHNVAAGTVNASSTDAVNGGQLYANSASVAAGLGGGSTVNADGTVSAPSYSVGGTTVGNVGDAITNIDDRVTQNAGDITNVQNQLADGSIGLVQQDATTRDLTVGKDTDGTVVNVSGTAGTRTVTGVAAGAVNATSVDAINGSQLYGTSSSVANALGGGSTVNPDGTISAPSYSVGGTTVGNVGDAVTNIDGRTTQNTTEITNVQNQLADGSIGLVQQDASTRDITVGKDTDGTVVNMAGTAGNRTVTGVAAGAVNATSVDAINGSQLYGASSSVANALGGGSTVNPDGTVSAPSYSVGGTTVGNVGDAITNIDGRTTQNTTEITNVQNQLADGSIGLVQQDATTRDLTVGKDTGGTVVNVSGTAGNRTVTGVAAGAVNATSVDAVNGSQLYGASSSVANALGGGSTVNPDGTISAPSYSVGGTTVSNVGDAITDIDGRVTENTTDITKLQNQMGDVGTQLSGAVQYDRNTDGSVNFNSVTLGGSQSAGPVVLTNVANGASTYDAVNFGQLSALQDQVTDLNGQVSSLTGQVSGIQPGSPSFTATNVPSASGDGSEVNAATPGTGVGSTAAGAGAAASGNYATVIGANASAAADNAVAVGANAAATGVNSTAIGTGSQAANTNSVALGQGSVTDRDNSVSVGSAGNERQITNVAAGTAPTDAVNLSQMNSSVAQGVQQANNYTDQRINDTNNAINGVARGAYSGIAAATALTMIPEVDQGKTLSFGIGAGTYKGYQAVALGGTARITDNIKVKAGVGLSAGGTTAGVGASMQW